MKLLKYLFFGLLGIFVIGAAAFAFAKIQHYPIPSFAIHFNHAAQPVAVGETAVVVPAGLSDAQASEPNTLGEGPDPAPLAGASTPIVNGKISGVPVLMYHYVGDLPPNPDLTRKDLTVSTANFTAQVVWLKSQGYQSITMDQLYAWLNKGTPIPPKSVVFTFDDGYSDVFENAVPILEANKMTGSFGIITGFVGTSVYATWSQISTARSQGMEIVSHSYSHPDFSSKSVTDQTYEFTKSDSDFSANLGFVPDYFIYPYGKYNDTTLSLLQSNGFLMAFTTAYGFVKPGENLLELPRVRVHGAETMQKFEYDLTGVNPPTPTPAQTSTPVTSPK